MKSKILKFLLVGVFVPSVTYSATESYSAMEEVTSPAQSVVEKSVEAEDPYSILMRARFGIQNWTKSDTFRSNSSFAYGTDIAFVWKSGFGISGHFLTGQSASSNVYGDDGKTRVSRLAIGPNYSIQLGKTTLQTGAFVGQMIVNEYYPSSYGAGSQNEGYRVYGASVGVDVPFHAEWFATLLAEYGVVKPVSQGSSFAVSSLSTGVGYRF